MVHKSVEGYTGDTHCWFLFDTHCLFLFLHAYLDICSRWDFELSHYWDLSSVAMVRSSVVSWLNCFVWLSMVSRCSSATAVTDLYGLAAVLCCLF